MVGSSINLSDLQSGSFTGYVGSQGVIGYTGSKGEFGGAAFEYNYSNTTSAADPGSGNLRFNSLDLSTATTLYIDFLDVASANSYNYLQVIDDSTSGVKGTFKIEDKANTQNFAFFSITGSLTNPGDYSQVPVAWINGVTSFTNGLDTVTTFVRTGDKGDIGYTGSQGVIGYTGSKGDIGYTGSKGDIGYTGSQGYTGSKGDIGYTGSKGDIGYTGSKGDIGYSGSQGYTGSQGIIGYTGSKGDIGYTGSQGYTGSKGDIGYTGSAGAVSSDTQVIYNSSGTLVGNSTLTFSASSNNLTVANSFIAAQHTTGSIGTGTGGLVANVTTLFVGNNTVNTLITSAGLTVNGATIANNTGVYAATVNAASHTVGTTFTANSTLVNAAALNVVNAINAASLYTSGNANIGGNLTVTGNLYVDGTQTFINTTVISTGDLNLVLAANASTNALANGAGIIIIGTGALGANLVYNSLIPGWSSNVAIIPSSNNLYLGNTSNLWNVSGNNATLVSANVGSNALTVNTTALAASANLAMANNYIVAPALKAYSEFVTTNAASTGATTLDLSASNFFNLTLTGSVTFTFSNSPSGRAFSFTVVAKQDATGGRTITWPAGSKYAGAVTPPATTTANAIDIWSVMTYDAGSTYIVSLAVKNAS